MLSISTQSFITQPKYLLQSIKIKYGKRDDIESKTALIEGPELDIHEDLVGLEDLALAHV